MNERIPSGPTIRRETRSSTRVSLQMKWRRSVTTRPR